MIGSTDPKDAAIGTIRFDFATHKEFNMIHASDSFEAVKRELELWARDLSVAQLKKMNDFIEK